MSQRQTRLYKKNSVYYFRGVFPPELKSLAKKGEVKYSLKTKDYTIALKRCREFSFRFDLYLEKLKMKVMDDNSLDLNENDLTDIQLNRLDEIENERRIFFKNNDNSPQSQIGLFNQNRFKQWIEDDPSCPERKSQLEEKYIQTDEGIETIPALSTSSPEFQEEIVVEWFKKYINKIIKKDNTLPFETKKILSDVANNKIKLNLCYKGGKKGAIAKLEETLIPLETYAQEKAIADYNKSTYIPTEDIQILLEALKQQKIEKVKKSKIGQKTNKTHWTTMWNKIKEQKTNQNQRIKDLQSIETRLERIFSLIDKEYLEDITPDDCDLIASEIYKQPWGLNKKPLANKTIVSYITSFKELMKEANKRDKSILDVRDLINPPSKAMVAKTQMKRKNFEGKELTDVFGTKEYYDLRYNTVDFPKFWVPLIALYSGCRLNEICQLEINNIQIQRKIPVMVITDTGFKQHLKNQQSKRIVPIHSKLIELGFLDLVEKIKKAKKYRENWISVASKKTRGTVKGKYIPIYNPNGLFFTLTYTEGNGYAGKISKWFNPLLKKMGIQYSKNSLDNTVEKLVFHCLRHTSSSNLSDNEVSDTRIDALCGWKTDGMRGNYIHTALKEKKKTIEKIKYKKFEKTTFKKLLPDPKKEKDFLNF